MELVTEPQITSADEAYCFLTALKQLMQYAGISDCDMEKGQMRCDVNISLREPAATELNPKTEIKNLNSFKAVHRAIAYEIYRQTELLNVKNPPVQATRGWNDDSGETYLLREKESAHDYRYFPEPDLMPIEIGEDLLADLKKAVPETPSQRRARLISDYAIPKYDANVLTADKDCADYFEACIKAGGDPKKISNWIMAELLRECSQAKIPIKSSPITPKNLVALLSMIDSGKINGRIAKIVFGEMFSSGKDPASIVEAKGLVQVTDSNEILSWVKEAIASHPGPVQEFQNGKTAALNFLVGQVMKLSKGKANPQLAAEKLKAVIAEKL